MAGLLSRVACFFSHDWGRWRQEVTYTYEEVKPPEIPAGHWVTDYAYKGPSSRRLQQRWQVRRCKRCGVSDRKLTLESYHS